MEYFDILDVSGNKTGIIKERTLVHKDGDFHRTAHIWVINQNKDVLLQKRHPLKDSNPNMWDISCAGHLSSGDESLDGALRELEEELGIKVSKAELKYLKTLKKQHIFHKTFIDNEFNDIYLLQTDIPISEMKFQEEEITDIKFVNFEQFKHMVDTKQKDLLLHNIDEFHYIIEIIENL